MWGPFGLSLAPQVRQSRALTKLLKPIANAYVNVMGHRQRGLRVDDLLNEESQNMQTALSRLPSDEGYDRAWRLRRAFQLSIQHTQLPKDQWLKPEDDVRYITPLAQEILDSEAERKQWDNAEPVARK